MMMIIIHQHHLTLQILEVEVVDLVEIQFNGEDYIEEKKFDKKAEEEDNEIEKKKNPTKIN
jgi:hypothetical protein